MKFTYHPDIDSLEIRFADEFGESTVNITHLAQASLDEHGRIQGLSIDRVSHQFRHTNLTSSTPHVTWQVPALGINVPLSDGHGNGTGPTDKLAFAYFPDSDTIYLDFADGPSDIVVDITDCDIADVRVDGTLIGITIESAQSLLQIEDPTTEVPEFQWTVSDPTRVPALTT